MKYMRSERSKPKPLCPNNPILTYVVVAPDVRKVKIGQSINPEQRLVELQVGSPTLLRLVAVTADIPERVFHQDEGLYNYHSHGEWYYLNEGFINEFDRIVECNASDCNFYDVNFYGEI